MKVLAGFSACALTLAFAIASLGAAQTGARDDDLLGFWGHEAFFGPVVRGELELVRAGSRWTIRIAGLEATREGKGDTLRLALPTGQGELRARVPRDAGEIRAFWIQPPGNLQAYATPIVLRSAGSGVWRGNVTPLDDTFSLYLRISRDTGGTLRAVFRNPEVGWTGRQPWFRVTKVGETLRLADSTGRERFAQPYDSAGRRITMDFGQPFALMPRTPERAIGFYARSPSAPPYVYRAPSPREDGWTVARARDAGMDEARLQTMVRSIIAADPAADTTPRVHSVLVARRGRLVLEEYFRGYSADRPQDLRSASKTFNSVMAGAVMLAGVKLDPSTPASRFLTFTGPADPRKERITFGHLLTHTTGLACDDNDDKSPGNENTMQEQSEQPDWHRYTLTLPVVNEPGRVAAYCSGTMSLAGHMIARATGMWLPEVFDRYVARPMGIERWHMNLTPSGDGYGGGGMRLLPRDLLKFGEVYLRGGRWNGRRIVSEEWVRQSTAQVVPVENGDGYGWHRAVLTVNGRKYQEFEANGNGGQFLIVVPELDLTVVFTASDYQRYRVWRKFRDVLMPEYIMSAALDK